MREYNPEGSALRRDQKEMLKALVAFAEICEKHDIKWWICSGTLLGAARHKGFIPWDDDMDVTMYEEDFRKLEKVLVELDSEEYFYQCIKTDPDHINVFGKNQNHQDKDSKLGHPNRQRTCTLYLHLDMTILHLSQITFEPLTNGIGYYISKQCKEHKHNDTVSTIGGYQQS